MSSKKNSSKSLLSKKKISELIIEADPLPQGRVFYLTKDVDEDSISELISQIISCVNQNSIDPITLVISTSGGSVEDMFSLYDILKFIPCPVHTVGLGKVMSAGVLILSSGKKGMRQIGKHTSVMIHPISDELSGNIFEISNGLKETQRSQKMMDEALILETKMNAKQLETIMKTGFDTYLTAEDAVRLGIADKIIG